jgi:hypothetical protein
MRERLEERLGSTMTQRAHMLIDGPRFSPDDIVRAGQAAAARRRIASVSGVVAGVAVLLIVVGVVAAARRPVRVQPAEPMPVGEVGLDVWSGDVVQRPDGRRVTLALPAGTSVRTVTGVPGGWVVATSGEGDERALWFAPYDGESRWISTAFGEHRVSPDGRVLVVVGLAPDGSGVAAYELPSLTRLASTDFGVDAGGTPTLVGVGGDRAVLTGSQGSPPWPETAIWNVRTGALHRTTGPAWAVGFARDGRVLRRVDRSDAGASASAGATACVDVVPMADTLPEQRGPLCTPVLATTEPGMLSPDGRWALLPTTSSRAGEGQRTVLLRTAELNAGRWRPIPLDLPPFGAPRFWDTDDSFVVERLGNPSEAYRCTATRGCVRLIMPAGLPRPEVVPRFGD